MRLTEAQIRRTVRGILQESYELTDMKIFDENGNPKPHFEAEVRRVAKAIVKLTKLIADRASESDPDLSNLVDQFLSGEVEGLGMDEQADLRRGIDLGIEEFLRSRNLEAKIILNLLRKLGEMSSERLFADIDIGLVGDPVNPSAPKPSPDDRALILSQSAREFIASMVTTTISHRGDEETSQSKIEERIYYVFRHPQHSLEVQTR